VFRHAAMSPRTDRFQRPAAAASSPHPVRPLSAQYQSADHVPSFPGHGLPGLQWRTACCLARNAASTSARPVRHQTANRDHSSTRRIPVTRSRYTPSESRCSALCRMGADAECCSFELQRIAKPPLSGLCREVDGSTNPIEPDCYPSSPNVIISRRSCVFPLTFPAPVSFAMNG
jgi:hypothetical protein